MVIPTKKTSPGAHGATPQEPEPASTSGTLRFADCELRIPARELWRNGSHQPLRKRVYDLLLYLIERRPATASHAEIAKAVWGRPDVRPSVIAQAVLHARRATGDHLEAPTLIVSVRGVGYRFGGIPRFGIDAPADPERHGDLAQVRAAVEEAQRAAENHDPEAALFLSENAITMARQAGANALCARAMAVASWAALHRGTLALASGYAFKALRLAEAEEHRSVAALARVRAANVLYAAGDLQAALELLQAVRIPEDVGADDLTALQCEVTAGRICGDLQRFDSAHAWLDRALRTSLRMNPAKRGLRERLELVNLHLKRADVAEAGGDGAQARQAFDAALASNEAIAADAAEIGDPVERICWHGNQGIALCGLGRVDEAWHFAGTASQMLEQWPDKGSPWYLAHAGELAIQWAALLHRATRNVEALERIQAATAGAQARADLGQLVRMASLASRASEALGDFESALAWTRRAQQAQQKLGLERLAQLACAYQASRDNDGLMRELVETRAALTSARAQVQQLREQLARSPQHDTGSTFLDPPAAFDAALEQRFVDAKTRDLPCLVGRLRVEPDRSAPERDTPATRQSMLLAAAAKIRLHLGAVDTRVSAASELSLVFTIEGVGARRGTQICKELQDGLNVPGQHGAGRQAGWRFVLDLCDLARFDQFEAARQALGPSHDAARRAKA